MKKDHHVLMEELKKQSAHIAALNYVIDAFTEAMINGVDANSVIEAALSTAFCEFVAVYGEESVVKYAANLPSRILNGEFSRSTVH